MAGAYVDTQSGNDQDTTINCGTSGTDRLMVFGVAAEDEGDDLSGITVDGKSCTFRAKIEQTGGPGQHIELWDIAEAALGASAGAVTLAINGVTAYPGDWGYHCRTFTGMAGTNASFGTGTAGDVAAVSITGVDNALGDLIVMFDMNGTDGITISSVTSPLGTILDDGDGLIDPYSSDLGSAHCFETSANTGKTWTITWSSTGTRHAAVLGVYAVASTTTRTLAAARVYDDSAVALAAQNVTAEADVTTPFRTVAGVQMVGDPPAESMEWRYRVVGDPDDAIESVDT